MSSRQYKEEVSILAFGSVGLSTMSYLRHNSSLPSAIALLVKSDFETKLANKANNSSADETKYESFMVFKDLGLVHIIDEFNKLKSQIKFFQEFPKKKIHFDIVGLGGSSGDFFLKTKGFENIKPITAISFCIMPFSFEGSKKGNKANLQLTSTQKMSGECIPLYNQNLFKGIHEKSTFEDAFQIFHKLIEEKIKGSDLYIE